MFQSDWRSQWGEDYSLLRVGTIYPISQRQVKIVKEENDLVVKRCILVNCISKGCLKEEAN